MSGGLGERVYNHPSLDPESQVSQRPGGCVGTACRRSHCLSQPCPASVSPARPATRALNRITLMKGTQELKRERRCFCITVEASIFCLSPSIFKNHKDGMLP